jgi:hypothetical protein
MTTNAEIKADIEKRRTDIREKINELEEMIKGFKDRTEIDAFVHLTARAGGVPDEARRFGARAHARYERASHAINGAMNELDIAHYNLGLLVGLIEESELRPPMPIIR